MICIQESSKHKQESVHLRDIIGNVAHDLKQPIQTIGLATELAQLELKSAIYESDGVSPDLDRLSAAMAPILPTCKFMKNAIDRSIEFTKINASVSLVPQNESFHLREAMLEPIGWIQSTQHQKLSSTGSTIDLDELPVGLRDTIVSDRQWLQENVICLLSNAIKHCAPNSIIRVRVSLMQPPPTSTCDPSLPGCRIVYRADAASTPPVTASGLEIKIGVTNEGERVPFEMRPKLFQPFSTSAASNGGTGLGLYSLRKRSEAIGGACGYNDNDIGMGVRRSEFWFSFPYKSAMKVAAHADASAVLAHAAAATATSAISEPAESNPATSEIESAKVMAASSNATAASAPAPKSTSTMTESSEFESVVPGEIKKVRTFFGVRICGSTDFIFIILESTLSSNLTNRSLHRSRQVPSHASIAFESLSWTTRRQFCKSSHRYCAARVTRLLRRPMEKRLLPS